MRNPTLFKILSFFLMLIFLPSCDIVGGIFKAGVSTGIFIAVIIVVVIIVLVMRSRSGNRRTGP
jgi:hypothetical protein